MNPENTPIMRNTSYALTLAAAAVFSDPAHGAAHARYFADWPTGASPNEIGRRVAENWLEREFDYEDGSREFVIYPEACTWYGALAVSKLVGDRELNRRLIGKFDRFLTPEGARHIADRAHVDYRVIGIVPLEIFIEAGDKRALEIGKRLADAQWENPTGDGVTREARYWIDDMYMIPAVQVQAFRATRDAVFLDRAALAMVAYLDRLQQPNGLFHHGEDSPFYWGRGDGWMAAGMAELLRDLPPRHQHHARIMAGYRKMMEALLEHQAPDGMWRQLIDDPESWPETSGTGMFAFAFVTGVKGGWLDAGTYGPAARKAWLALVAYIDGDANVRQVCVGTNKAAREVGPDLATQRKFYLERPRRTGDLHGQAPILWTASALLR